HLVLAQAAEKAHLDDLALALIDFRQRCESLVEGQQLLIGFSSNGHRLIQFNLVGATAALLIVTLTSEVDEDLTHETRRDSKEVRAVSPFHLAGIDQTDICLVDQCRRLEGMTCPLAPEVASCDQAQFGIDERN